MAETEGVIKYRLQFETAEPPCEDLSELNVCRSILHGLHLIGQDATRYQGYGFGNLSRRSQLDPAQFIISGTQTGHLAELQAEHYARILQTDITHSFVQACGRVEPSSEALTHAMFYRLNSALQCVIHVHSPELWHFGLEHAYPTTHPDIAYGTTQMAQEIERLYQSAELRQSRTLVMAGHEDGVICFGDSIDLAGQALLHLWVDSRC
ncbi:MAG: class II aldolase/adducin family protein [Gammaproteobacteria bacterium]|nr:class II aldolase/adducin family protein [Gammaproteobacteria bacterium]MBL6985384.1 class II aldolase/adducin family protein [Candidatus Thioglobus sp.]MBL6999635.1 class II aldolase/adducin family protein [Gammaproteobacteria bacterium]